MPKKSRLYDYSPGEVQTILNMSNGYIPALRMLGIGGGSSVKTLKLYIKKYKLDVSICEANAHRAQRMSGKNRIPLSQILVENSTYLNFGRLKIRLIDEGLKVNKCETCGIDSWLGKPIVLQLHHKNGINNDNRLCNLQLLCPNCHSQTDTYCGANCKKK